MSYKKLELNNTRIFFLSAADIAMSSRVRGWTVAVISAFTRWLVVVVIWTGRGRKGEASIGLRLHIDGCLASGQYLFRLLRRRIGNWLVSMMKTKERRRSSLARPFSLFSTCSYRLSDDPEYGEIGHRTVCPIIHSPSSSSSSSLGECVRTAR